MERNPRGFSITLVFGSYGGFYAKADDTLIRICLGWVALTIYYKYDIESFMEHWMKQSGRDFRGV